MKLSKDYFKTFKAAREANDMAQMGTIVDELFNELGIKEEKAPEKITVEDCKAAAKKRNDSETVVPEFIKERTVAPPYIPGDMGKR